MSRFDALAGGFFSLSTLLVHPALGCGQGGFEVLIQPSKLLKNQTKPRRLYDLKTVCPDVQSFLCLQHFFKFIHEFLALCLVLKDWFSEAFVVFSGQLPVNFR